MRPAEMSVSLYLRQLIEKHIMKYNVTLPLPDGWTSETEEYEEIDGAPITHLSCSLADPSGKTGGSVIDLYLGDLPDETTARDEAFANYAEMVGWDDDDDETDPIAEWRFQNRRAFGFSALCEDESPLLLMCVEIKKGALLIANIIAPTDEELQNLARYVEFHLRLK